MTLPLDRITFDGNRHKLWITVVVYAYTELANRIGMQPCDVQIVDRHTLQADRQA